MLSTHGSAKCDCVKIAKYNKKPIACEWWILLSIIKTNFTCTIVIVAHLFIQCKCLSQTLNGKQKASQI